MNDKSRDNAAEVNSAASTIKRNKASKKADIFKLSRNKILQGIIFSEIIGKPKGRRSR